MCPGQIRGGQIKIKSPAGQKCMSHGKLFWPAGDYFSPRAKICVPRAIILARGRKMTKPTRQAIMTSFFVQRGWGCES